MNPSEIKPETKQQLRTPDNQPSMMNQKQNNIQEEKKQPKPSDNQNLDVENKIRNKEFASKEELVNYLNKLDGLTTEKKAEYLNLYDELYPTLVPTVDLKKYKSVGLEESNYIVGTANDVVLKTNSSSTEMPQDFEKTQNELTAMGNDSLANADQVFEHMRDHQKEEKKFMSINEAINLNGISVEVLNKIKFFVSNRHINPHEYKVDPESGIFYNPETDEILEVRKNKETGKYELYNGAELAYTNNSESQTETDENENENELEYEKDAEEKAYENKNVKTLRLVKDNNKAFVKSTFLFMIIISIGLILSLLLFIKK